MKPLTPLPPRPPGVLPRGAMLGRYLIVDVLGWGGMGVVYSAYDTQLDRKLAIKLLRHDLVRGENADEIEARLLREAQAMARLTHPNVVAVHDVGTYGHRVFLAMELVEGVTLKEWLRTPRPPRARMKVMLSAGRGLAAAHAAGLIHRDFKPDNVIVGSDGRVVVLDFGLARAQGDTTLDAPLLLGEEPVSAEARARDGRERGAAELAAAEGEAPSPPPQADNAFLYPLTQDGSVMGTIGFMAPELVMGETATAATDQFSFAATAYFAMYGERPFPAQGLSDYIAEVHEPIKDARPGSEVPLWLRRVIVRGLRPDGAERFPSMDAMLHALDADPTVARRRALALAAGGVALILGVVGVTRALRQKELACAPDPTELAGVWDGAKRAATTEAFAKTGVPGASASAGRIFARLDEFAAQWTQMRADVCRATRIEKRQPEDLSRLRNDCLDRERTELRSLTSLLANADAQVVAKSIDVAYGLPNPAWCADVPTLRASAGLPDDPAKRSRVLEVRAKLAEVEPRKLAGKLKEAGERAALALALAREVDHPATTAEAALVRGGILGDQGDFTASLPLLREAVFLASGAGADSTVVEAATELVFVTGPKLQRAEEARIWLELARAAVRRIGGNERLELNIHEREADLLDEVEWRPEEALPIEEKNVASCRRVYGVHPKTQTVLYNIGVSYAYLGDPARARPYLEEAVSMGEAIGGPTYSGAATADYMLGQSLVALGEFDPGEALLRKAIAVFDENGMDYWSALASHVLTWLAIAKGDIPGAVASGDRARAMLIKAESPSVLVPIVYVPAALALTRAGRASEALPLCDKALAEEETAKAIDPTKAYWSDALRCKGEALIALGQGELAVPLLERSLTLKRRVFPGDYARAELTLARALAASHRDPARAAELALAARAEFDRAPFLSWERREVDSWLEQRAVHSR